MAGQSNMQGYMGDASQYPTDNASLDKNILFYYLEPPFKNPPPSALNSINFQQEHVGSNWLKDLYQWLGASWRSVKFKIKWPPEPSPSATWTRLGPQWGRFPSGHFGPEITFARHLAKAGYNPAIFKYTKESTSLAENWKGPGEGGLYDHLSLTLNKAIIDLKHRGYRVNIKALVWIQGENDALTDQHADEYSTRLKLIIKHLNQNTLPTRTPIIFGADENHPEMLARPQVRKAQENIASNNSCAIRSQMHNLIKADTTHLTPKSISEHGTRIFVAYLSILNNCHSI